MKFHVSRHLTQEFVTICDVLNKAMHAEIKISQGDLEYKFRILEFKLYMKN